ncbi:CPK4 [Symbiodinium natans]|uniref:CPK4 protein n=1 Tax=Symbiodinium natans TaxID=878477 RepID=A0A812RIC7_9DINO|nr:CPK4 [Symbiodinium natans]
MQWVPPVGLAPPMAAPVNPMSPQMCRHHVRLTRSPSPTRTVVGPMAPSMVSPMAQQPMIHYGGRATPQPMPGMAFKPAPAAVPVAMTATQRYFPSVSVSPTGAGYPTGPAAGAQMPRLLRSEDGAAPAWKDMQQRLGRTASSVATTVPPGSPPAEHAASSLLAVSACQSPTPSQQPARLVKPTHLLDVKVGESPSPTPPVPGSPVELPWTRLASGTLEQGLADEVKADLRRSRAESKAEDVRSMGGEARGSATPQGELKADARTLGQEKKADTIASQEKKADARRAGEETKADARRAGEERKAEKAETLRADRSDERRAELRGRGDERHEVRVRGDDVRAAARGRGEDAKQGIKGRGALTCMGSDGQICCMAPCTNLAWDPTGEEGKVGETRIRGTCPSCRVHESIPTDMTTIPHPMLSNLLLRKVRRERPDVEEAAALEQTETHWQAVPLIYPCLQEGKR